MSSIVELTQPAAEPVDLTTVKNFLRLTADFTSDDGLIENIIIPGARRQLETALNITLANRQFVQYEDSFPFYPYFQSPYAPLFGAAFPFYFGYGPVASYPYPAIGGLQMQMVSPFVKSLLRSPVTAVDHIDYVGTDGKSHGLRPGRDFVVDFASKPGRIAPLPGQRWPVGVLSMSTVGVYFTAGYLPQGSANIDPEVGADWAALTVFAQNSYVLDSNGNVEVIISATGKTGDTEPLWPTTPGATTTDGAVTWRNLGPIVGRWQAGHNYTAPVVVQDSRGNLEQLIVGSLTSGGSEPGWEGGLGAITSDNSIAAWMNIGADQSQGAKDPPQQTSSYPGYMGIPENLMMALMHMITHWYQQRSVVVTTSGAGGTHIPLPLHLQEIIESERVLDFSPSKT